MHAKRDILKIAAGTMAACGAGLAAWPFISQMSPSADVAQPIEVQFSDLKEGESKYFLWRGTPHVLRHRTPVEIEQTNKVEVSSLRDQFAQNQSLPETALATVENRSFGPDGSFVVLSPVCTHLSCLLNSKTAIESSGLIFDGYYCLCHGASFDSLGRVYGGPANLNLPIPKFRIRGRSTIVLGTDVDSV